MADVSDNVKTYANRRRELSSSRGPMAEELSEKALAVYRSWFGEVATHCKRDYDKMLEMMAALTSLIDERAQAAARYEVEKWESAASKAAVDALAEVKRLKTYTKRLEAALRSVYTAFGDHISGPQEPGSFFEITKTVDAAQAVVEAGPDSEHGDEEKSRAAADFAQKASQRLGRDLTWRTEHVEFLLGELKKLGRHYQLDEAGGEYPAYILECGPGGLEAGDAG